MRAAIGCKPIDDLLAGGVESGIITEVYGPAGSGKTNFCIQLCKGRRAVYIDSEGVSLERMLQICEDVKDIQITRVRSFDEQHKAILSLQLQNPEIVLIDSMVILYRLLLDDGNAQEINRKLAKQVFLLSELADKMNIPVVITNQVYSPFGEDKVEPAAGDPLKYWPKCIIALEKLGYGRRKAVLVKHRSLPEFKKAKFKITQKGLE